MKKMKSITDVVGKLVPGYKYQESPSDFILSIGELSNIKKGKDVIYCNNENIFSFNDKNIELWRQKYQEGRQNKKDLKTKIPKDTIMRFIITTRKQQIKENLTPIFTEYADQLNDIIQNMLKYEFLGFVDFPHRSHNYKFFNYYIGENNDLESIKKTENWKLLNTNLLALFHLNIDWEKHLKLENIPMSESLYTTTEHTRFLSHIENLYNEYFKKPKIINTGIKDLIINIDARFIYKKYLDSQSSKIDKNDSSKQQKSTKRKRENENNNNSNSNNKKRKIIMINEDDLSKKDERCVENALKISPTVDLISPDAFQKRMNIVPENISFTTNDFINILKIFTDKKKGKIVYDPSKIAEIIISALNPIGIINNAIRKISQRDGDTIRNSDWEDLIKSILNNKEKQEYLRNEIFSHINAIFTLALLTRDRK